ncbi:MAG: CDP-archaeol synthase, partial [Candidatus Diapherotrites archaeon]|nr:CDP-archaeol synthase [Candidatus Diapherotrites archaeon]
MTLFEITLLIFNSLLLIFPAYVSNSAAIIFGGWKPIDFNKNWFDGKRILGNGKTISGSVFGVLAGFLVAIALNLINPTQLM